MPGRKVAPILGARFSCEAGLSSTKEVFESFLDSTVDGELGPWTDAHVFADADNTRPLAVSIYLARKQDNPPAPNSEYKRAIVEGTKFWHLPASYIAELDSIEVKD
jgi:hypothetical protein